MFGKLGASLDEVGEASDPCRRRLKASLELFRGHVAQLVALIPKDMVGYTVHDVTHLDALWGCADTIVGETFTLNPAEAYVLGGAILLHDAGMTVAAYVGGRAEVEATPQFKSALSSARTQLSAGIGVGDSVDQIASTMALVEALRELHPERAQSLATQAWKHPVDKSEIRLIEDSDLRAHYGDLIGRIAHSHHWDHSILLKQFSHVLGQFPGFPADWTVDPLKVALVLRCADAAHLDARRAPRILFAATRPQGYSELHWTFQSQLAPPAVQNAKLLYASTSPFSLEMSEAWQLAYDTLQMVDRELRSADEIHISKGMQRFAADGVLGAGSPEQLSMYVRAVGWRPVALSLRVSDVPHLAKTLGGRDLYSFRLAPLRELIQNAADAVEARGSIDTDYHSINQEIRVKVIEEDEFTVVEVSDTGVGMSERVLTGALLDFGFSFWKSSEARREFPGLEQRKLAPRGRYGIGFFSVFMWADSVAVTSRRFSDGPSSTRVLEFRNGLGERPVLRDARADECSSKWITRIQLRIRTDRAHEILDPTVRNRSQPPVHTLRRFAPLHSSATDWVMATRLVCGALPIRVFVSLKGLETSASLPDWKSCSPSDLFRFFGPIVSMAGDPVVERFSEAVANVVVSGEVRGRAFILPTVPGFDNGGALATYDRGIFAGIDNSSRVVGIVEAEVTNAARDRFVGVEMASNLDWLKEAAVRSFGVASHVGEELALQKTLGALGYQDRDRIHYIINRDVVTPNELIRRISKLPRVLIRLIENTEGSFVFKEVESLTPLYGMTVDSSRIYTLLRIEGKFDRGESFTAYAETRGSQLANFFGDVYSALGGSATVQESYIERQNYQENYLDIEICRR